MEFASLVMQDILNIIPDADESLVAEAATIAAGLGETRYECIVEYAMNLYLENVQSEILEPGLLSNQQYIKHNRHMGIEETIQETKQTPSGSSSQAGIYDVPDGAKQMSLDSSSKTGKYETTGVTDPTKQTSSDSSTQSVKYKTNSVLDGFSSGTESPILDCLGERQNRKSDEYSPKVKTDTVMLDAAKPIISMEDTSISDISEFFHAIIDTNYIIDDGNEKVTSELQSTSDQNEDNVRKAVAENTHCLTFGETNCELQDKNNEVCKMYERNEDPESKTQSTSEKKHCNFKADSTDNYRQTALLSNNDEWPTLQTCRHIQTPLIKTDFNDLKTKVIYIDLTLEDDKDSFVVNDNLVKVDIKPEMRTLNHPEPAKLTHQTVNKQVTDDLFLNMIPNSRQFHNLFQSSSKVSSLSSPGCSFWPDFDETTSEKDEINTINGTAHTSFINSAAIDTTNSSVPVASTTVLRSQIIELATNVSTESSTTLSDSVRTGSTTPVISSTSACYLRTCSDNEVASPLTSTNFQNSFIKPIVSKQIQSLPPRTHQTNTQVMADFSLANSSTDSGFFQSSSTADCLYSPGCSFRHEQNINTANKTTINEASIAPQLCTVSSGISGFSENLVSPTATFTTLVASAANLGSNTAGLSYTTVYGPSNYHNITSLVGASSSHIVSSNNYITSPEVTTMTSLVTSSDTCQKAEGIVANTSVDISEFNHADLPSALNHSGLSAATNNIQSPKLSSLVWKSAVSSSWLQSRLHRALTNNVTSAPGLLSSPGAVISSSTFKTIPSVTNTATMATQGFQKNVSGNQINIYSANCIVRSEATLPPEVQSKLQSTVSNSVIPVYMTLQSGCVSSLNNAASSSTYRTVPAITKTATVAAQGYDYSNSSFQKPWLQNMCTGRSTWAGLQFVPKTATMASQGYQNSSSGFPNKIAFDGSSVTNVVNSYPLLQNMHGLSWAGPQIVPKTATMDAQGFPKYGSSIPVTISSAGYGPHSRYESGPSVTASSTPVSVLSGIVNSINSTETAITNTVAIATRGCQKNVSDVSTSKCIALDYHAEKRQNETCNTVTTPKKMKLDSTEEEDFGNCSLMDSDVDIENMEASILVSCLACLAFPLSTKHVQCNNFHNICKSCLKAVMYSVITTDKMNMMCPVPSCNGEIPLDALSSLKSSVAIKILMDNIHKKQLEASLKTIQQLKGLVSCPRCSFAAQLDEGVKVFICANNDCKVKCCRYCKAPWLEEEENVHVGCSLLEFCGTKCFKDISVLPDNWTVFTELDKSSLKPGYASICVPLNSVEGKRVCDFHSKTSRHLIVKLTRIQNQALWEKYVLKRKHMKEEIGEEELREKFLFHGTEKQNIDKICREGFDFRKLSANGRSYGKGSYFSTTAAYSETFSRDSQSLFLVRVLCGRSTEGRYNHTHPPYEMSGRMYDSCHDRPWQPMMYIVYSIEQCYPAYVIEFKR